MVLAGRSPSPEGITWPLEARLHTTAFTSCEAGRSRFCSCAEQAKSLLLFVYFLIRVFCATCKGSKGTGGLAELGFPVKHSAHGKDLETFNVEHLYAVTVPRIPCG